MELPDFLDETNKLTEWYLLGVYLKLPTEELDDIEKRFSSQGLKRCKIELFRLWDRRGPMRRSWDHLAQALEKCGETVLAGEIRTLHSPTSLTHTPAATSQLSKASDRPEPVHMASKTDSSQAKKRQVSVEMKQFQELERAYASLMSKLQTALEEKVSLKELKRFLQHLLDNDDLSKAGSVDELFHMIKPYYSFLNTARPRAIILEFVQDLESLKPKLEEYEKQLEEFTEFTELSVLKEIECEPSSVEMPQVILKMAGCLCEITIKRFEELVEQIFKTKSNALTNIRVEPGCIQVSWSSHRSAIPALVTQAQQKVEFIRHVGVLRLSVGDTIILDQQEREEEYNDIHLVLLQATMAGCADTVEFLLTIGANPNCSSENGDTPLIIACRKESTRIASLLLKSYANVNLQNEQGCTALMEVCRANIPNEGLVKMLVEAGADVDLSSGEIQLSEPGDNEVAIRSHVTPLAMAAQRGNIKIVQYLLDEGAAVNKLDEIGASALEYASYHGHTEIVSLLLKYGADVNTERTTDGTTALMPASQNGYTKIVRLLLNYKADTNKQRTTDHMTAFMIASQNGHTKIVRLLLEHGADVKAKTSDGTTAFMFASQNGRIEIVRLLHSYTADVNDKRTTDGATALMLASIFGQTETVRLLLSYNAAVNTRSKKYGFTALIFAAGLGFSEIVRLLLNDGAPIVNIRDSIDSSTALHHACYMQEMLCVQLLLAKGADTNIQNDKGFTPLMLACLKEYIDIPMSPAILSMLLSADAHLNTQTKDGKTALILAAYTGYQKGVKILLNAGADVNIQDSEGATALHAAANEGYSEITELLLASGAQTSITDNNDNTPLDLALEGVHDDVCELLITHMLSDPQTITAAPTE